MINDYSISNTAHSSYLKQNYPSGRLQILVNYLSLGLGSTVIQLNITSGKLSNDMSNLTIFCG